MKILILVLILIAFLQSTILPFNLVLIILILRAYVAGDKYDLFLAFFFGLFMAHLNSLPLGPLSIIYLGLIELAKILARSHFSQNIITVIILMLGVLGAFHFLIFILGYQTFQIWPKIAIETLLSIPLYYLIKIWEERFMFKREVKLRM